MPCTHAGHTGQVVSTSDVQFDWVYVSPALQVVHGVQDPGEALFSKKELRGAMELQNMQPTSLIPSWLEATVHLGTCPAGHDVAEHKSCTADCTGLSTGHCEQVNSPADEIPAPTHCRHVAMLSADTVGEYFPAAQSVQPVRSEVAYLPGVHAVQNDRPAVAV